MTFKITFESFMQSMFRLIRTESVEIFEAEGYKQAHCMATKRIEELMSKHDVAVNIKNIEKV